MIRVMRRLRFIVLLLVVTLFAQNAAATLAPMLESSYYDGFVFYYEGGLRGRIDFAVYDTEHSEYGDEYVDAGITAPGDGQYIYAYQIFNDYPASTDPVAYFAVLDIDGATIDLDSIGSQEDPETGIAPGDEYFDMDDSKVVWEFNGDDGYVIKGEHSWFLVFSSEYEPVKGDYEIRGPDAVPAPLPEPAMIALLGLGSTMVLMRRRRSV